MGESTAIAWTDHTFNPWWGCTKVSPACDHCYAETFAKRTGNAVWGNRAPRRFFGDKHWSEPLKWDRAAEAVGEPRRVFCASMADVFENRADLVAERDRLFDLIENTPHLTWQLLTKRPQNVVRMTKKRWPNDLPFNVWIGTTVENEAEADKRVPHLLKIPAAIRFLSCEPLLDRVRLGQWCAHYPARLRWDGGHGLIPEYDPQHTIDWVICGGESGPGHRPMNLDHARLLLSNCRMFKVPFFFKQVGGQYPKSGGDLLDGVAYREFPAEPDRVGSGANAPAKPDLIGPPEETP